MVQHGAPPAVLRVNKQWEVVQQAQVHVPRSGDGHGGKPLVQHAAVRAATHLLVDVPLQSMERRQEGYWNRGRGLDAQHRRDRAGKMGQDGFKRVLLCLRGRSCDSSLPHEEVCSMRIHDCVVTAKHVMPLHCPHTNTNAGRCELRVSMIVLLQQNM